MTARVLRPAINLVTVGAVIIAALAVYFAMGTGASHADSVFVPTSDTKLCNAIPSGFGDADINGPNLAGGCTETAGNLATGANSNITSILNIPSPNLNFSQVVTFSPPGFVVNDVPTSTKVGALRSLTTLGLINGACNTTFTVDFVFYDVALPNNANPALATNIAYPDVAGTPNRNANWHIGSQGAAATPLKDTAPADDRADFDTASILNYPSHILDAFDPTPGTAPATWSDAIVPAHLYGGLTKVVGDWQALYFAVFTPGQLASLPGASSLMNANMGSASVSVLNDPTSTATSPSSITDFCSPLGVTTMLLGVAKTQPGGANVTRAANPASAGTYPFLQYAASLRDADQDGYENAFDTCAKNPNTGSGRITNGTGGSGDTDADGIDDVCEPNGSTLADGDGDGFDNRQDNCPKLANALPNQADEENTQTNAVAAADKGPKGDSIGGLSSSPGTSCDNGPLPGGITQNGVPLSLTFSETISNGRWHAVANVTPKCIGGTDADGDGYCAGAGDSVDSGPGATVRHGAWNSTHPGTQMDVDGDKVADAMETYHGTDATKSCPATGTGSDEILDNWPLDITDDGLATTSDLGPYASSLNKFVGEVPAATVRNDFDNDGFITTLDLGGYAGALNRGCGAFLGSNGSVSPAIPAWSQQ